MSALKPGNQAHHRRPQHTDFFSSKLMMNKPKISPADINEIARQNHSERTLKVKEIL